MNKIPYFLNVANIDNWMKKFAFIAENREQVNDKKKFTALVESIRNKRRILCAIEVIKFDKDNPDHYLPNMQHGLLDLNYQPLTDISHIEYLVVDGQHRILALREIDNDHRTFKSDIALSDITVKICVDPSTTRSDIYDMNNTGTPWKTINYIKSFAESQIGDYPSLLRKINLREREGFKVGNGNDLSYIYSAGYGSDVLKQIRTQTYEYSEEKGDKAIEAAKWFRHCPGLGSLWCNQNIVRNIVLIQKQYSTFDPQSLSSYLINKNIDITEPGLDGATVGKVELKRRMLQHWFDSVDSNNYTSRKYSKEQKQIIADRDRNRSGEVVCCGRRCAVTGIENMTVDHKDAWDDENPNTTIENGVLLCQPCNSSKQRKTYEEWDPVTVEI